MSGGVSLNFRSLTAYGSDPRRQMHQLEQATREAFARLQNWIDSGMGLPPFAAKLTAVTVDGNGYLTDAPNTVHCVDTSAARLLTMPEHETDLIVIVKDETGSAASNNITLARYGDKGTIDGTASSYTISTNKACRWFMSRGVDWMVIASAS